MCHKIQPINQLNSRVVSHFTLELRNGVKFIGKSMDNDICIAITFVHFELYKRFLGRKASVITIYINLRFSKGLFV